MPQAGSDTMQVGWSFSIQGRARPGSDLDQVQHCPIGQSLATWPQLYAKAAENGEKHMAASEP